MKFARWQHPAIEWMARFASPCTLILCCFVNRTELLLYSTLDRQTASHVDDPPRCSRSVYRTYSSGTVGTYSSVLSWLHGGPFVPHPPRPPRSRWVAVGRAQRAAAADHDRGWPGRRGRRRDRGDGVLPPSASLVSPGGHGPLLPLHRLLFLVISSFPLISPRPLNTVLLPVSGPRRRRGISGSAARLRRLLATNRAICDPLFRDSGVFYPISWLRCWFTANKDVTYIIVSPIIEQLQYFFSILHGQSDVHLYLGFVVNEWWNSNWPTAGFVNCHNSKLVLSGCLLLSTVSYNENSVLKFVRKS